MPSFTIEQITQGTETVARDLADVPGGLLPILHRLQDRFGYVPQESVAIIAKTLQLSRAEVHGVISFYHYFRSSAPGRRTLYVCRSEACQSMGGKAIEDHARKTLGVDWHGTSADQSISLEPIYCLGNCACAPSVMLDEQVIGRVTPASLDKLIDTARS